MQTTSFAALAVLAAFTAAAASNAEPGISSVALDDSSYNYCNPGYPSVQSYTSLPGATLEFVQAVVRHGDRTPVSYIPNDDSTWRCDGVEEETYLHGAGESKDNTTGSFKQLVLIPKWNGKYGFSNQLWQGSCEEGELTDRGKRQHNTLGTQLRSIYVNKLGYLPANLNSTDEVYLRTTHIWRTKNSAESLLGALWPKRGITPQAAIPMHTYPKRIETMYGNRDACPGISTVNAQIMESKTYQDFLREQGPLMARLADIMDVRGSGWTTGWDKFFDVLNARHCHDMKLPCSRANSTQCATAADVVQATRNANHEWRYKYRDSPLGNDLLRLDIGSFVGTLRDQMQDHINGHAGKLKLALYSGHDSTVWPLLFVLRAGSRQSLWPPYASNLIFELWKQPDGSRVIRVIFNGEVLQLDESEKWCDMNACPVDTFFKHVEAFIPSNITSECAK
ncbi:hypothetical protein LPJ63_001749 [Coemansia sp. RSA 2711]|nr:hypothetical protein LPJ63_001749 [Coemansia sp. RSA 2711]KAJ2372013.1 hypothetical protein H4S02_009353 [Coemansia sp. RSA 2611]